MTAKNHKFANDIVERKLRAIRALISSGVDLNALDSRGTSELSCVSKHPEFVPIVAALIDAGADATVPKGLRNPLRLAIEHGSIKSLELMLSSLRSPVPSDVLPYACKSSSIPAIHLLLAAKADVNKQDDDGYVPMISAVGADDSAPEIIDILVKAGADVSATVGDGITSLYIAASIHRLDMAQSLIKHGANVNLRSSGGLLPLYTAIMSKNRDMVRLLIKAGADVNIIGVDGIPLFIEAVSTGSLDITSDMLAAGADVNTIDSLGQSALHISVHLSHATLAAALLKAGADVLATASSGETVMHAAAQQDSDDTDVVTSITEMLVDAISRCATSSRQ
jgi:ankyrin repeat protein